MSDSHSESPKFAEDKIADLQAQVEELRRERDLYKACFENAPSGILLQTLDGVLIDLNPALCEPRGWNREELIGKHVTNIAHEEIRSEVEGNLARIRNGEVLRHTVRSKTHTGEVLYSVLNESRISLGENRHGILVMSVDITELKCKEQELQVSKNRNTALIQAIPDMLFRINRNGDFLELHPGEYRLTNRRAEELIGKNMYDFDYPIDILDAGMRSIEQSLNEQKLVTFNYELDLLGETKYLEARIVPIDQDEVLEMVRDITLEKMHEEEMTRALQIAEDAAKAKASFLAHMSHEIRTPLNGIIGVADLMAESTLNGDQIELLRVIQESSAILLELISDILDFSRIDAGKIELELSPFSLKDALRSALMICSPRAKVKEIELNMQLDLATDQLFLGDQTRLRQIVINLISNGIKFTEMGEVSLTVEKSKSTDTEVWFQFTIKDTGVGISPEGQAKIFSAFTQEESSTTRKYGGTGLGLTISKSLVELMGGTLSVSSEVGKGSTFSFEIPFTLQEEIKDHFIVSNMKRYQAPSFSKMSFLVVDDNRINQRVIIKLLESLGVETIECASNGKIAYEKSNQDAYDIILMDCQMPVMDGFESTQLIREKSLNSAATIIALTANALKGTEEECLSAGMDAFLTKPIRKEELKQKIMSMITPLG